jgi:hypothetical protein
MTSTASLQPFSAARTSTQTDPASLDVLSGDPGREMPRPAKVNNELGREKIKFDHLRAKAGNTSKIHGMATASSRPGSEEGALSAFP